MTLQDELLFAQADRADAFQGYDAPTEPAVNQADVLLSKLDSLNKTRENKLNSLSQIAGQQINYLTPEQIQYQVGYAMGEQILSRPDGSRYKFALNPDGTYAHDASGNWIEEDVSDKTRGRDLYAALTDAGNYKLGLAKEGEGFKGRYNPDWKQYVPGLNGYGWSPGPEGVNPDKEPLLNATLPYDVATDLEKVVYSNIGQIKSRVIGQGPVSVEDDYAFGSGKTEYTTPDAPLWNVDYKDDGTPLQAGTPLPKGAYAPGAVVDDSGNVIGYESTKKPSGFIERTANALAGGAAAFTKELGVDFVDWVGELTGGWDLGTEEEKSKVVNDFFGYDTKNAEEAQRKVAVASQALFDPKASVVDKAKAVAMSIFESAKTPELLATSLGTIGAWFVPGAVLTKGKKFSDVAGVYNKVKHGMKQQAGQINGAIGNINDQYEEFVKNNNGIELEGQDKIEWFASRFSVQMFNQNLDAITAVSILKTPGMLEAAKNTIGGIAQKDFNKFLVGVGKTLGTAAVNMPKEAAQEYTQRMMELYNERYGSEQFKDLDSFVKFMSDEGHIKEGTVDALMGAGGALQFQALSSAKKPVELLGSVLNEARQKKIEQRREEVRVAKEQALSDVEVGGDYVDSDTTEVVNGVKVFEPISNLKAKATTSKEFTDELETQMQHVVASVFDITADGKIPALSKFGKELLDSDVSKFDERVNKVVDWFQNEYGEVFKDDATIMPKIQAEIDEVIRASKEVVSKFKLDAANLEKDTMASEAVVENVKANEVFREAVANAKDDAEVDALFEGYVEESLGKYIADPERKKAVARLAKDRYSDVSGMALSGVSIEFDRAELLAEAQEEASIKAKTRLSPEEIGKTPVVNTRYVTNEVIDTIFKEEGLSEDTLINLGLDSNKSTKLDQSVIKKLDPVMKGIRGNVTKHIAPIVKGINKAIEMADSRKVSKVFKGINTEKQMQRLLLVALNTIDAATVSDTELRKRIDEGSVTGGRLKPDQWYASEFGIVEQIGKNYTTSLGIKIEGSPSAVGKAYRDIGNLAIDSLSNSGLIEIDNDIVSVLSDKALVETKDGELVPIKSRDGRQLTGITGSQILNDSSTDDTVLIKDRGIRLTGTVADSEVYENKAGDAIKRISKLLFPNSIKVPDTEPSTAPVKVNGKYAFEGTSAEAQAVDLASDGLTVGMKVSDAVTDELIKFREMKARITPESLEVFKYIKGLRDKADGSLYTVMREKPWIKSLFGVSENGAKLTALSESGSNNQKLQYLNDILDNLDNLSDGFHYEYQVDIQERITLMESVLNFQADKTFARAVVTAYDPFELKGDEVTRFVDGLIEDLKLGVNENIPGYDGNEGKKESKEAYDAVRNALLTGSKDIEAVNKIRAVAKFMASDAPIERKLEELSIRAKSGEQFSRFEGKVFQLMGLLTAINDVTEMSSDGTITTRLMQDNDSRASGVFNTLLNIVGRNPKELVPLLTSLGVQFEDGEPVNMRNLTDAYRRLADTVSSKLGRAVEGLDTTKEGSDLGVLLDELDGLGIDMRELAKPPVMTWFYSAGEKTITKDLTDSVIFDVVTLAANGDKKAIKHISRVLNKDVSVRDVKNIARNSAEHKALVTEYNKIGKAFSAKLDEAFPGVKEYKDDLQKIFNFLAANSTVNGKDYWKGHVRTAYDSKGERNLDNGYMALYKNVQVLTKSGSDAETSNDPVIYNRMVSNWSSAAPLQTQNIDAGNMHSSIALMNKNGNPFVMTIHDDIRGQKLDDVRKNYEEQTVEFAKNFDMVDNLILSAEVTRDRMMEAVKVEKDGTTKTELEAKIKVFNKMIAEWKGKNDRFITIKKELLDGAVTNSFGLMKADTVSELGVEVKVDKPAPTVKVEKVKPSEEADDFEAAIASVTVADVIKALDEGKLDTDKGANDINNAIVNKDSMVIDEFLASNRTSSDVVKLLDSLLLDSRLDKASIERLKTDANRLTFDTASDVLLKKLNMKKNSGPFYYNGVIYLNGSKDVVSGQDYTVDSLVDTIGHEIEHAITNGWIVNNVNTKPVKVLDRVIKQLVTSGLMKRNARTRAEQRLKNVISTYNRNGVNGIQELVATLNGEPSIAGDVYEAITELTNVKQSFLGRVLSVIKDTVAKLIKGKTLKEINEMLPGVSDEINTVDIAIAAEVVNMRARQDREADTVVTKSKMSELDEALRACKRK